jgi:cell division control protein 6
LTVESPIFADKRVFKETYVPDKILHRDAAFSNIQRILGDFQRNAKPRNILCIGDLGTGKTVALRSICRNPPAGVKAVFVNCAEMNTQTRIFRAVLERLGVTVKTGFPGDHYLGLFKAALPSRLILVLDEVDKLIEHRGSEYEDLLYVLMRTVDPKEVVLIMLTNKFSFEMFLTRELDSKVKDTLPFERVEFPDYIASELNDIITARAQVGLKPSAYDSGTMAQISRIVYERGLRARGLIDLCRKAGELAESKAHDKISEEDVSVASVELIHGRGLEVISRLPPYLRAILGYVLVKSPTVEDAYDAFKKTMLAHDVTKGMFYGYLKELEVFGVLEKKKISLGYGKGVIVKLNVPSELTNIVYNSLKDTATPSTQNEFSPTTYTIPIG